MERRRLASGLKRLRRLFLLGFIAGMVWLATVAAAVALYGRADRAQPAEAIVVLGAGVRANNRPTSALWRRTYQGALLWEQGFAPHIICTGAVSARSTVSEAFVCGQLLKEWGVPAEAILLEEASRSTEENALNASRIMNENGWETAIIVSDGYHLLRANWMFDKAGVEGYTSPVRFVGLRPGIYARSLLREVMALHWQALKDVFGLEITNVPLV